MPYEGQCLLSPVGVSCPLCRTSELVSFIPRLCNAFGENKFPQSVCGAALQWGSFLNTMWRELNIHFYAHFPLQVRIWTMSTFQWGDKLLSEMYGHIFPCFKWIESQRNSSWQKSSLGVQWKKSTLLTNNCNQTDSWTVCQLLTNPVPSDYCFSTHGLGLYPSLSLEK